MLDIKHIRKDPEFFLKKISERNINIDLKNLLNLDIKNRNLIKKKESLEQEKKKFLTKKIKNFSINLKIYH